MKLVREHIIFEKFTEDSDPIKDLGIGIINKKIDFKSTRSFLNFIYDHLAGILGMDKIPDDIIFDKENPSYFIKIEYFRMIGNYIYKYLTINGKNPDEFRRAEMWACTIRPRLSKAGYKYVKKLQIDESLNEKFTEEGDPIRDMGIGYGKPINFNKIAEKTIRRNTPFWQTNPDKWLNFLESLRGKKLTGRFGKENDIRSIQIKSFFEVNIDHLTNRYLRLGMEYKKISSQFFCIIPH